MIKTDNKTYVIGTAKAGDIKKMGLIKASMEDEEE